jgi:hypothetical protein
MEKVRVKIVAPPGMEGGPLGGHGAGNNQQRLALEGLP